MIPAELAGIEQKGAGQAGAADTGAADTHGVMLVRLAGATYALPVVAVREIVRLPPLTRVPGLPAFVAGLANVRGRVLAVIDLRPLLHLDAPRGDRLVILDGDGRSEGSDFADAATTGVGSSGRAVVGLIVDAALNLVQLPGGGLEPLPHGMPGEASTVLDGMTVLDDVPVAVLSPAGLLALRSRLAKAT